MNCLILVNFKNGDFIIFEDNFLRNTSSLIRELIEPFQGFHFTYRLIELLSD